MAGSVSEDNGAGRSSEGISSGQRCQSGESLSEWRSCEQVENGTPSTSPPYWDTDDDDDCGVKPSELYGRFTWKIEDFSQITKRELRSNAFEVGDNKWYILIYPQGCDVCNHLSLFLCVANHDKLLPGWSHFAQFTIAVVNKDPKKSKYSDTLHRFWKKEHDWGWKKFMELSKVSDGFIVSDTLVIKAQVQVIREKTNRPFRCLDCQYRRELVRVYLSNVELICRRFVEEKRGVLGSLIEDKVRWSSFRAFWLGVDQNVRQRMSRDKTDAILKDVVKAFFIEKEVTSTLVMDSLYSGLRALECQNKNKTGIGELVETEETPSPIIFVEKDLFVLADDVLVLLERAAMEPLPPKDDKGPQNRTKDGSSGDDFNKDSIERDERQLTELGRRTVEIFVLSHIFSKIEAAYREAVAFKRQEELIREEEAAGQAEGELKAKRGATEKEKHAKKKQSKQKRRSRKGKDKGRDVKCDVTGLDHPQESPSDKRTLVDFSPKQAQSIILDKPNSLEDVSDVSDAGNDVADTLQHDLEDRDGSPVNWDTDTSEIHPSTEASSSASSLPAHNGGVEKKNPSIMDDSSSTCSTDSVPSVVMNGPYKGNSLPSNKSQTSPGRGKNTCKRNPHPWTGQGTDKDTQHSDSATDAGCLHDPSDHCTRDAPEPEAVVLSLTDQIHWLEKEEEVVSLQEKLNVNGQIGDNRSSKQRTAEAPFSLGSPQKNMASSSQQKQAAIENTTAAIPTAGREASSNSFSQREEAVPRITRSPKVPSFSRSEVQKPTTPVKEPIEKPATQQVSAISRPSSAPVVPAPRPNAPIVSLVQTSPLLSRSVSPAGRLGTGSSPSTQGYIHQSYRSAIMGNAGAATSASFAPHPTSNFSVPSISYSQPPCAVASMPIHSPQVSAREKSGFAFGREVPSIMCDQSHWVECSQQAGSSIMTGNPYHLNGTHGLDTYGSGSSVPQTLYVDEALASVPHRQVQGPQDDFPHLDIINYLFDEDQSVGKVGKTNGVSQGPNTRYNPLSRHLSFPGDACAPEFGVSANCCRFDNQVRVDDGFGRMHRSSSGPYDSTRGVGSHVGLPGYMNDGQIGGMIQNQWQANGPNLTLSSARNAGDDGYPFPLLDYSNLPFGVNGYSSFRPASGH